MSYGLTPAYSAETQHTILQTLPKRPVRSERIEREALRIIATHPHFQSLHLAVDVECCDETLVLTGRLPTYFFKQLLQEALRTIDGVRGIDNRVLVASSHNEAIPKKPR